MYLSKQGTKLTIWMAVFTVVITTIVGLRFIAANIKRRMLRPDDFMIVIAYVSLRFSLKD